MTAVGQFARGEPGIYLNRVPSPDGCARCWYCGAPLAPRHEHDHVVPRACGGTVMVAACMNCHELKDRTPFDEWDAAVSWCAVRSVPVEGPAAVLLARLSAAIGGGEPVDDLDASTLLAALAEVPQDGAARLWLAKLAATALHGARASA